MFGGGFGQQQQQQQQQQPQQSQQQRPPTQSLFGQTPFGANPAGSAPSASSTSAFGSGFGGTFGQPSASSTTGGSGFGTFSAPATAPASGSNSGGLFGSSTTGGFGTSTGGFGNTTSGFGSTTGGFGASTAPSSGLFAHPPSTSTTTAPTSTLGMSGGIPNTSAPTTGVTFGSTPFGSSTNSTAAPLRPPSSSSSAPPSSLFGGQAPPPLSSGTTSFGSFAPPPSTATAPGIPSGSTFTFGNSTSVPGTTSSGFGTIAPPTTTAGVPTLPPLTTTTAAPSFSFGGPSQVGAAKPSSSLTTSVGSTTAPTTGFSFGVAGSSATGAPTGTNAAATFGLPGAQPSSTTLSFPPLGGPTSGSTLTTGPSTSAAPASAGTGTGGFTFGTTPLVTATASPPQIPSLSLPPPPPTTTTAAATSLPSLTDTKGPATTTATAAAAEIKPPTTTTTTTTATTTSSTESKPVTSTIESGGKEGSNKGEEKPPIPVSAMPLSVSFPSNLKNKTLEDIILSWNEELETLVHAFERQAVEVATWDRKIIANGQQIVALADRVDRLETFQRHVDQNLAYLIAQQGELETSLAAMEGEVKVLEDTVLPPGKFSTVDGERERIYEGAESVQNQVVEVANRLSKIIYEINAAVPDGTEEGAITTRKDVGEGESMAQVAQILNAHLDALQWIEHKVEELRLASQAIKTQSHKASTDMERLQQQYQSS